jgi:hypothetical protein
MGNNINGSYVKIIDTIDKNTIEVVYYDDTKVKLDISEAVDVNYNSNLLKIKLKDGKELSFDFYHSSNAFESFLNLNKRQIMNHRDNSEFNKKI